jgi:hypothetical protein
MSCSEWKGADMAPEGLGNNFSALTRNSPNAKRASGPFCSKFHSCSDIQSSPVLKQTVHILEEPGVVRHTLEAPIA